MNLLWDSGARRTGAQLTALVGMLSLGMVAPVGAGDDDNFRLSRLSVPDELTALVAEDLNADGLKDFLIVHSKGLPPDETRWLSIFWQDGEGDFSTAADQSWELDADATVVDVGNVADDARKEICILTPQEVRYYAFSAGGYVTDATVLLEAQGMTRFPAEATAPLIDFVRDWNDDGIDDIAVFTFSGLSIYFGEEERPFASSSALAIELDTHITQRSRAVHREENLIRGLETEFSFPSLHLVDFNSDGRRDLITTLEDRLAVYQLDDEGRFSAQPTTERLFDIRTQQEKIEDLAHLATVVRDLNGDGFSDAVVTKQVFKGLSSVRGVLSVFWGGPTGYAEEADQKIISEGTASVGTVIADVNGDGRLDLILPSLAINLKTIVRLLLTRNLPVSFNIFLLHEDGRYADRPDFTKEIKFKIDFSGDQDDQTMGLDGDFDGDGRKDFVFATKQDELSIYLGIIDGKRLFSKKPTAKVRADAYGELYTPDLNGDGYSDMYIYYTVAEDRKGLITVLMNRGQL